MRLVHNESMFYRNSKQTLICFASERILCYSTRVSRVSTASLRYIEVQLKSELVEILNCIDNTYTMVNALPLCFKYEVFRVAVSPRVSGGGPLSE